MSGFVWITTELDDTTLYHYEKIECIRPNCKYKNRDETDKDGCEEDLHVSHAIVKRSFWPLIPEGSTRDVTGSMAQFKMANVSNLEELLLYENGLLGKTNYTYGVPETYTKQLREKKCAIFGFTCPLIFTIFIIKSQVGAIPVFSRLCGIAEGAI